VTVKRIAITANCVNQVKMWYRVSTECTGEEAKRKPKAKYMPSELNESVKWRLKG
jgi:hypothetical protein